MIPGARGCTPQTCAFRDLFAELKAAGAGHVFGLSTQSNAYQTEMASRLHLPFPVLSDEKLVLTRALNLPTMEVAGLTLIKRLALIVDDARISHVFYPVFPPDRNAGDVLAWLKENPGLGAARRQSQTRIAVAAFALQPLLKPTPARLNAKSAHLANTLRNISGVSTRVLVL